MIQKVYVDMVANIVLFASPHQSKISFNVVSLSVHLNTSFFISEFASSFDDSNPHI
jgi:hypothetical protein